MTFTTAQPRFQSFFGGRFFSQNWHFGITKRITKHNFLVLQSTYLYFVSNEDHTFEKKNVSFLLVTSTLKRFWTIEVEMTQRQFFFIFFLSDLYQNERHCNCWRIQLLTHKLDKLRHTNETSVVPKLLTTHLGAGQVLSTGQPVLVVRNIILQYSLRDYYDKSTTVTAKMISFCNHIILFRFLKCPVASTYWPLKINRWSYVFALYPKYFLRKKSHL